MGRVHQLPSCRYCFQLRLELNDPNYECARCSRMRLAEVRAIFAAREKEERRRMYRRVYWVLLVLILIVGLYLAIYRTFSKAPSTKELHEAHQGT